jgi:hypothetical protein
LLKPLEDMIFGNPIINKGAKEGELLWFNTQHQETPFQVLLALSYYVYGRHSCYDQQNHTFSVVSDGSFVSPKARLLVPKVGSSPAPR